MDKTYILVNPPILREERYSSKFLGAAGSALVPLGILYIASYLENKGYNVEVIDAEQQLLTQNQTVEKIKEIADKHEYCYVGMSATTVCFNNTLELAKKLKERIPNLKIILGGVHVTALPEHAISFDCFDFGIIGEGEVTTYELLETLIYNGDVNTVNGIVYKKDGNLIYTPPRELIKNLDELPFPARHLLKDITKYIPGLSDYKTLPVTNIITSRGCPGLCTFCSNAVFGRTYRSRSALNIFQEIKEVLQKYKVREIHFIDDTFLLNKKRVHELFDLCNNNNLKFTWSCYSRIDNVNPEFLKFLKQNGCWRISFGIESGDKRVLDDIRKRITLDNAYEVISYCNKIGIKTTGLFMIGHPTDTIESINNTINFAIKTPFTDAACCISTPLPGSEQFKENFSQQDFSKIDFSKFNTMYSIITPKRMTNHDILMKQKEFYKRFYLRPRIITNYILSLFSFAFFRKFKTLLFNALYLVLPTK
jgi:radical SAM superfamily enzyme YgiQ (UPF0313 family)